MLFFQQLRPGSVINVFILIYQSIPMHYYDVYGIFLQKRHNIPAAGKCVWETCTVNGHDVIDVTFEGQTSFMQYI